MSISFAVDSNVQTEVTDIAIHVVLQITLPEIKIWVEGPLMLPQKILEK